MDITGSAEKLFSITAEVQAQQTSLSNYALSQALDLMQNGKYAEAVPQLRQALARNPQNLDAYSYLGAASLKLGKYTDALAAYGDALRLAPNSADASNNLGNAYLEAGRIDEAEARFKRSERLNPLSTYAPYALGHLYLQQGRLDAAVEKFSQVVRMAPRDPNGHLALGMAYNKLGRYEDAEKELKEALRIRSRFDDAVFELGLAYAGQGKEDEARQQVSLLRESDPALADLLDAELFRPRIAGILFTAGTFDPVRGPGTELAELDPLLAAPGASKDFTLVVQFNAEMGIASVRNAANWSITKASGGAGGWYNYGVTLHPEREALVPPLPKEIIYDPIHLRATVVFTLTQNAAGNAIIDPSHLVFSFRGEDVSGATVDPSANEYNGFAVLPF